mgnify:FL=1
MQTSTKQEALENARLQEDILYQDVLDGHTLNVTGMMLILAAGWAIYIHWEERRRK